MLVCRGTRQPHGVPQIECDCRPCTSCDPRDRRTRTAALIESGGRRLLIDTPPELRLQLVAAGAGCADAVLITHDHAEHVQRSDEMRTFSPLQRAPLAVYGAADVPDR